MFPGGEERHRGPRRENWEGDLGRVAFPGNSDSKEPACQCRRPRFNPWVRKISWRRKWLPTPVFLPRKSHGQKSLGSPSPWGHKGSDMTERLILQFKVSINNQYLVSADHMRLDNLQRILHCILRRILESGWHCSPHFSDIETET